MSNITQPTAFYTGGLDNTSRWSDLGKMRQTALDIMEQVNFTPRADRRLESFHSWRWHQLTYIKAMRGLAPQVTVVFMATRITWDLVEYRNGLSYEAEAGAWTYRMLMRDNSPLTRSHY